MNEFLHRVHSECTAFTKAAAWLETVMNERQTPPELMIDVVARHHEARKRGYLPQVREILCRSIPNDTCSDYLYLLERIIVFDQNHGIGEDVEKWEQLYARLSRLSLDPIGTWTAKYYAWQSAKKLGFQLRRLRVFWDALQQLSIRLPEPITHRAEADTCELLAKTLHGRDVIQGAVFFNSAAAHRLEYLQEIEKSDSPNVQRTVAASEVLRMYEEWDSLFLRQDAVRCLLESNKIAPLRERYGMTSLIALHA